MPNEIVSVKFDAPKSLINKLGGYVMMSGINPDEFICKAVSEKLKAVSEKGKPKTKGA